MSMTIGMDFGIVSYTCNHSNQLSNIILHGYKFFETLPWRHAIQPLLMDGHSLCDSLTNRAQQKGWCTESLLSASFYLWFRRALAHGIHAVRTSKQKVHEEQIRLPEPPELSSPPVLQISSHEIFNKFCYLLSSYRRSEEYWKVLRNGQSTKSNSLCPWGPRRAETSLLTHTPTHLAHLPHFQSACKIDIQYWQTSKKIEKLGKWTTGQTLHWDRFKERKEFIVFHEKNRECSMADSLWIWTTYSLKLQSVQITFIQLSLYGAICTWRRGALSRAGIKESKQAGI